MPLNVPATNMLDPSTAMAFGYLIPSNLENSAGLLGSLMSIPITESSLPHAYTVLLTSVM